MIESLTESDYYSRVGQMLTLASEQQVLCKPMHKAGPSPLILRTINQWPLNVFQSGNLRFRRKEKSRRV